MAAFLVAVLAGSSLLAAGFLLGTQAAATGGTPADLQDRFKPFWEAYNKIDRQYVGAIDQKKLVEGAINGLFEGLGDPYSGYMSSEDFKRSLSGISGQFEGIGATMATRDASGKTDCTPISDACRLTVVHVIRDSPALKAGLQPGDVVTAVDGVPTSGQTIDETVARVRGPRGTVVHVTVQRGSGAPFELAITRDVIQSEDVTSEVVANGTVGYLRIEGFSSSAAGDFTNELRDLVATKGVRRIVLDLRNDPGGFVDAARTIASQFVGSGPVYFEQYADGRTVPQDAEPGGVATDPAIHVVVLVNKGTASASEIVAGAIQDTGRGQLVGEKTFGKGTIQQWHTLANDTGGFRLSVAKWLTPRQRWIHGVGLEPDVPVAVPPDSPAGSDPVLERALQLLSSARAGFARLAPAA